VEQAFQITDFCRKSLEAYFDKYSLGQLNKIPEGFSNNLIWNIGHVIVTQQLIVNRLSGLPVLVSDDMIGRYKRGSRPQEDVSQEEADALRALVFSTISQTRKAIAEGQAGNFTAYTTTTGFEIRSLAAAVQFNNYHEATHLGIMLGIRKFV